MEVSRKSSSIDFENNKLEKFQDHFKVIFQIVMFIQFLYFIRLKTYSVVAFAVLLFGSSLKKRIKATILYATETGNSENFAKQLIIPLKYLFNVQVNILTQVRL